MRVRLFGTALGCAPTVAIAVVLEAILAARGQTGRPLLAAVARPARDRRVANRDAAARVERDEEHPVEGRDSRPRLRDAGRLGRSGVRADGRADDRRGRRRACAARTVARPHKFIVMAIDRKTGKLVWERVAKEEAPHEASHPENGTLASASAVDRRRARDRVVRVARLLRVRHERASSSGRRTSATSGCATRSARARTPALHGNHLVIVWDHQGQSFIVALDKRTGEELWRKNREGDRHVGHAARRDRERPRAGDRDRRHEPGRELRPRDRRRRVGNGAD